MLTEKQAAFIGTKHQRKVLRSSIGTSAIVAMVVQSALSLFALPALAAITNGENSEPSSFGPRPDRMATGMQGPQDTVYDADHDIVWVSDQVNNRVTGYDVSTPTDGPALTYVLGQQSPSENYNITTNAASMYRPNGLDYDPVRHFLFIADKGQNRVMVFDLSGSISNGMDAAYVIGQPDFFSSGSGANSQNMHAPAYVAYDSLNDYVWVSDQENNRVLAFSSDPSDLAIHGTALQVLGQSNFSDTFSNFDESPTPTDNGFRRPQGLAVNGNDGILFVADTSDDIGNQNARVLAFDIASVITNGMPALYALGEPDRYTSSPTVSQTGTVSPAGLRYDDATNRLFVADFGGGRNLIFNYATISGDGSPADAVFGAPDFDTPGGGTDQYNTNGPVGIGVNGDTAYVAEQFNNRVTSWNVNAGTIDPLDPALNEIGQDAGGTAFTSNDIGTVHELYLPHGMSIDAVNDRLYVADTSNNRVLEYDLAGGVPVDNVPDAVLGQPTIFTSLEGTAGNRFEGPTDVLYNNDRLFVADSGNNRVLVFSTVGLTSDDRSATVVLGQATVTDSDEDSTGEADGMSSPQYLAYDTGHDRLYVSDSGDNRVLVFNGASSLSDHQPADNVLGQTGFGGGAVNSDTTSTTFDSPRGIAYDVGADRLFVVDSNNDRVLVFHADTVSDGEPAVNVLGQSSFTTAFGGASRVRLSAPFAVAYDEGNDRLFLTDSDNNRVLVYEVATLWDQKNPRYVLGQPDFDTPTYDPAPGDARTRNPRGITYDAASQQVLVAENLIPDQAPSVQIFDAAPISVAASPWTVGRTPPEMNQEWAAIATDGSRLVAVSKSGNFDVPAMYSDDEGETWQEASAPGTDIKWNGVAYGEGVFVAVGSEGASGATERVMVSADGINWSGFSNAPFDQDYQWYGVTYDPVSGRFVAAGGYDDAGPDAAMMYVDDPIGDSWVVDDRAAEAPAAWSGVTTNGLGRIVAVGGGTGSQSSVYSDDGGDTWAFGATPTLSASPTAVAFGNGKFVSVSKWTGTGSDLLMFSSDGISWTLSNSDGSATEWRSVAFGDDMFVAVGNTANGTQSIYVSEDGGNNWAFSNKPRVNGGWSAVTYHGTRFVAVTDTDEFDLRTMYAESPDLETGGGGGGGGSVGPGGTDVMSREKQGVPSTHHITITLQAAPTAGDVTMNFAGNGSNFDFSGAPTGYTGSDGECVVTITGGTSLGDITFTVPGTCGIGDHIIITTPAVNNSTVVGSHLVTYSGTSDLEGEFAVPITSEDQITVTASVNPFITFDLEASATVCSSGTASPTDHAPNTNTDYTVAMGTLSPLAVTSSGTGGSGVDHVCATVSTNAASGYALSVKSLNGGLKSGATYINNNATETAETTDGEDAVATSAEHYVMCLASAEGNTVDTTAPAGATLTPTADFDGAAGTCTSASATGGALSTNTQLIGSTGSPYVAQEGTSEWLLKASIAATTPAGSYSDTLTFIATGTF